jgi:hypothetical protein
VLAIKSGARAGSFPTLMSSSAGIRKALPATPQVSPHLRGGRGGTGFILVRWD